MATAIHPDPQAALAALEAAKEKRRKAQIKAIKAAQRTLGLDDTTYRAMLRTQTGKDSATALTLAEGARVLDHLRRAGAVNPKRPNQHGGKRRPVPAAGKADLMAKVHALLHALSEATGRPHGLSYADAIAKRNGWGDAVDFCSLANLHALVGALSRTVRNRQAAAGRPVTA